MALCFVRLAMAYIFTVNELYWLDHLIPDATRRKREDDGENDEDKSDKEKQSFEMFGKADEVSV